MSHADDVLARYRAALIPVFGVPQTVLSHGDGCYVVDVDGWDRAVELAGELSLAPGKDGKPIHEWLEVRPFYGAPSATDS